MAKEAMIFGLGLCIGAAGATIILKKHYEDILNDEIESVKQHYQNKYATVDKTVKVKEPEEPKEEQEYYNNIIEKLNYNEFSTKVESSEEPDTEEEEDEDISIISSEEYFSKNEFDKLQATFWKGDEIAMDINEEILDIDILGGIAILNNVDAYEDDVIYVRNIKYGSDYEVIISDGSYADFMRGM